MWIEPSPGAILHWLLTVGDLSPHHPRLQLGPRQLLLASKCMLRCRPRGVRSAAGVLVFRFGDPSSMGRQTRKRGVDRCRSTAISRFFRHSCLKRERSQRHPQASTHRGPHAHPPPVAGNPKSMRVSLPLRGCWNFPQTSRLGAIAQLEERLDRTQEVAGSSPASSICRSSLHSGGFCFLRAAPTGPELRSISAT